MASNWRQTPAGQAYTKRWNRSPAHKEAQRRYLSKPLVKAAERARWHSRQASKERYLLYV